MKHVPPLNCETSFHVSSKTVYLEVTKVCAACLSCLSYPGKGREEPKRLRERTRLRSHCNRVSSLLSSAIWVSRSRQWCCHSISVSYQGKKSRTLEMNSYVDFHINATCFLSCSSLFVFFFKYYFFKYYF